MVVEPRLIDLDYGEWQGRPTEEIAELFPQDYAAWLAGDVSLRFPGGEAVRAPVERLHSFVDEVVECHQGEVVAMVTHNVLCQMATCLLLNIPLHSFPSVRHDPGSLSIFRWSAGSFSVDAFNLPPIALSARHG